MISVAEARARILAGVTPVAAETVALTDSWGRVLAAPVPSRVTQPPADLSAMDGYAVRAAEANAGQALRVVGQAPAGQPYDAVLNPGEAVRIFTGAYIPEGADGILLQEDARAEAGEVTATDHVTPGRWVRLRGLDFAEGDTLLPAGHRLTARDVGLAAAGNHAFLTVRRRPRIGILATGDEIMLPGEPPRPASIYSSNSFAIAAMVRAAGGEPSILPVAPDDRAAIASLVESAAGLDVLVTSGGASVGEHDLVREVLEGAGFSLDFWRIAMRPGKPLFHGRRAGGPAVLGLPGNPVSAFVCGVLFLLPLLAALQGRVGFALPVQRYRLGVELPENDQREDYLRAELRPGADGAPEAHPAARQDSSMLRVLAGAQALVIRAPHAPALARGAEVEAIPLDALGL
ncbi:molybdopterin molybdotransferase MoeA [Roseococcus thiosulfatophilus]|uniref:molybdopterin molybdotransferase MoeA n=1 Tax=Roseococcus thiosulfatophilus TaxID=35813 RepID=UPI001A8CAC8C|nr:gephyrin-like molybdotransferase Glp [Roseococcus thiosulfatophilus]